MPTPKKYFCVLDLLAEDSPHSGRRRCTSSQQARVGRWPRLSARDRTKYSPRGSLPWRRPPPSPEERQAFRLPGWDRDGGVACLGWMPPSHWRIVQVLPQSNNKQAELLITSLDLSRPLDSLLDPFVAAWPLATCYLLPQYLRSFYLPFHCDTLYVSCFYSLRHCTDWRQYRVDNTWKQCRRGLVILQNTGWMMRRASKWYHARPLVWMTAWNTLEKSHRSNHQVIESSARHQTRSLYDNVLGESAQFSSHVKIGDIPHSQLSSMSHRSRHGGC